MSASALGPPIVATGTAKAPGHSRLQLPERSAPLQPRAACCLRCWAWRRKQREEAPWPLSSSHLPDTCQWAPLPGSNREPVGRILGSVAGKVQLPAKQSWAEEGKEYNWQEWTGKRQLMSVPHTEEKRALDTSSCNSTASLPPFQLHESINVHLAFFPLPQMF